MFMNVYNAFLGSYGLTIEGKEGEGTTIRLSFVA